MRISFCTGGAAAGIWFAVAGLCQTPCEQLKLLKLPNGAVTAAELIPLRPASLNRGVGDLPAHCRVAAVLTPTLDSHIEMELWMPISNWNGKFQAVGNGGWAGTINSGGMATALSGGYAAASTDTGHKSSETPGGSFAPGHPEKLIDFGNRAVHEMTVFSKNAIAKFYGNAPRLSYWNSCSNGGRQGLMEAQRFPKDYDGVVAGSPASNWTGRALASLWVAQAVHKNEASYIPPAKLPYLHKAALLACDLLDGVEDGIIGNPMQCKFDPGAMLCKGADESSCLTSYQVDAARTIYSATDFYPGLAYGSELGWNTYGGPKPFAIGNDYGRFVLFNDPAWDYISLDFATAPALARRIDNGTIDALNPNLRSFFANGGKLVQYHGWSDPQIPPMHSVNYYESVLKAMGAASKVQDSYRLFMVPGMNHCSGGPGTDRFDPLAALEQWREGGVAPERITASHVTGGKVDLTRPLCPWPAVARYKGSGSTSDAGNFSCR